MREIEHIVIHHSASPLNVTAKDIDAWHRAKGWAGLGYHIVVEGKGKMVRGRELSKIGAHVRRWNKNSIGICVVGNNTKPRYKWRAVQIASLAEIVRVFEALFPEAETLGHRDIPGTSTACPGLDVRALLKGV